MVMTKEILRNAIGEGHGKDDGNIGGMGAKRSPKSVDLCLMRTSPREI